MIGELAALGASLSWAIAPILYRKALLSTKPLSANIVRCATNAAVMIAALLLFGLAGTLAALPMKTLFLVIASGVIGLGVGDTLYMIGLKYVGISRAVPLAATYPLFSLIWATFLLGQSISIFEVLGALIIIFGIWLLSRERCREETCAKGKLLFIGLAASLVTAVIWSVSITMMNIAVSGLTSLGANYAIITLRIASVALFFMLLAPFLDRDHGFIKMKRSIVIALCVGGLVANGVGWLLLNYSFQNTSLTRAVPISSTSTLFASIVGFMLFREKMTTRAVLGAIAIVAGICVIFIL